MLRTSKKARKQAALFHSRASIGFALPGAPQTSSVGRPQQPFLPRPRVSVTSESSENQLEGGPLGAQEKDDDEMEMEKELEGAHIARVQLSSYATSTQQHNEIHPQLQDRQRSQQLGLERSREGLALPEERAYISTSASASVSASTTNGEGEDFCFDLDDRAASGSEPTDLSITEVSPTPPSRQERKVHSLDREGSLEAGLASSETRQGNGFFIEKRLDTDERIKETFGEEQGETLERDWGHDHDGAGMYPDKDSGMSPPVAPTDDVDVWGKDGVLSNLGDDVPNITESVNKADGLPGRRMIVDVSSKSSSPLSSPTSESRANELSDELQNDADDEDDIDGTGADAEVHSDSSSLPTLTPSPSPRRSANVVENAEGDNREELHASDETEGDATATAAILPKRTTSKTFRSPKQVVSEPLASGRAKRQLTKSSKAIEAEEMRWLSPKRRKMAQQQVHEQDPRSTSVEKQEHSRPRSAKLQRSSKLSEIRSDLEHKEAQPATELPPVPVKRGRGRPRKHPLPTVLPGASSSGSQNAPSALLSMKNSSAQESLARSSRGAKRLIPPSRSRHEISTNAFYRRRRGELPNSPLGTSFKSSVPTATGPRSNIKTQRRSASLSLLRKATLRRSDREIDTETVNSVETEENSASDEESIIVEAPKRRGRPPSSGTKVGLSRTLPKSVGKTYLVSGLYSNDYKNERTSSTNRLSRTVLNKNAATISKRRRKETAMPFPIYHGVTVLTEHRNFRLTYDVFTKGMDLREKKQSVKKPPAYSHISSNKYPLRAKLAGEKHVCDCKIGQTCDETCLNRHLLYLCDPKLCPCGDKCTNNWLSKRPTKKTEVRWFGPRGFGLVASEPIEEGEFIDEYRGEVIDLAQITKRTNELYRKLGNYYYLDYDTAAGEVIDSGLRGNITRFANHSCDPNCQVERWLICGEHKPASAEHQIGLFAKRDIAAGEELTYFYNWKTFRPKNMAAPTTEEQEAPIACLCGSANCSGTLGGKKVPLVSTVKATTKAGKKRRRRRAKPNIAEPPGQLRTDPVHVVDSISATKRKSGARSKRHGAAIDTDSEAETEMEERPTKRVRKAAPVVEVKRRGPGRPRKVPLVTDIASPPPPPPRPAGRGRPVRSSTGAPPKRPFRNFSPNAADSEEDANVTDDNDIPTSMPAAGGTRESETKGKDRVRDMDHQIRRPSGFEHEASKPRLLSSHGRPLSRRGEASSSKSAVIRISPDSSPLSSARSSLDFNSPLAKHGGGSATRYDDSSASISDDEAVMGLSVARRNGKSAVAVPDGEGALLDYEKDPESDDGTRSDASSDAAEALMTLDGKPELKRKRPATLPIRKRKPRPKAKHAQAMRQPAGFDETRYPPNTALFSKNGNPYNFDWINRKGRIAQPYSREEVEQFHTDKKTTAAAKARERRGRNLQRRLMGQSAIVPATPESIDDDNDGSRGRTAEDVPHRAQETAYEDGRGKEDENSGTGKEHMVKLREALEMSPAWLEDCGMGRDEAKKARTTFLTRVRRLQQRGYGHDEAMKSAFLKNKPSPGSPLAKLFDICIHEAEKD